MNIERKMDFIVENLAALTVRLDDVAVRLDNLAARQEKTDRQIRGLQTLVKTGMKMMVNLHKAQIRTDRRMAELAEAQKRTDERFDRWLNSLNRGANGHKKKPN